MSFAIRVKGVQKTFKLPHEKQDSLKNLFINLFRGQKSFERQLVLKDTTFDIEEGEFFGIVGRNGSGKSTLLKMLAGIYEPNKGTIEVNGSLTPFIELGVGFNPNLSGRENVYLNGALLGFDRKEVDGMYDEIVEFAELDKFMDQKLKNYSSGMQVRLAFSIAIRARSDILLLDEVLAVGDALFQKKCYDYFRQLKRDKRTVVFVSHDSGALQEYCTKGILIDKGEIIESGPIDKVLKRYQEVISDIESGEVVKEAQSDRRGSGKMQITSMVVTNDNNSGSSIFKENEDITIHSTYKAKQDVADPIYGITIKSLTGEVVFQSNTLWCKKEVRAVKENEDISVTWTIPNVFNAGKYTITPAVSDKNTEVFDCRDDFRSFKVTKEQKSHGVINTLHGLEVTYDS